MNEIKINVNPGTSKRLLTAGKYCDRDIIITASDAQNGLFVKVGTMNVGYTHSKLDITGFAEYQSITANDIYFVPQNFIVSTTETITGGTYNIRKTYTNGIIEAWRDSVPGKVGISFDMDVYVYVQNKNISVAGTMVKIATKQPLTYGDGVSIDVTSQISKYADLTVDSFFLDLTGIDMTVTTTGGGSVTVNRSYDATTGIFKFSRASIPFSGSMNNYCDVYAFVPL